MLVSEKINCLLNYLNVNAKSFSEALGYERPQIIYDIQKGKTKHISPALADKIVSVFPEVNRSWLLADEGEMLRGAASECPRDSGELTVAERLVALLEKKDEQIDRLLALLERKGV